MGRVGGRRHLARWTDEEIATLRQLWMRGEKTSVIALEMGRTKVSLVCKASELGIRRPS